MVVVAVFRAAEVKQRRRLEDDVSLASNDGESVKSIGGQRRWPMFIEKRERTNGMVEKDLAPLRPAIPHSNSLYTNSDGI
jgi:hypothetical protein